MEDAGPRGKMQNGRCAMQCARCKCKMQYAGCKVNLQDTYKNMQDERSKKTRLGSSVSNFNKT